MIEGFAKFPFRSQHGEGIFVLVRENREGFALPVDALEQDNGENAESFRGRGGLMGRDSLEVQGRFFDFFSPN